MILTQVIANNRIVCALISTNIDKQGRFNIMFVCYSKSAHEYEQNKVEAYFIGRVLSFVDWIRTLIPGPCLVQDLME